MREMEILKGLEGGENMAVQFVDHLLALGLRKKASDIHLEPGEEQMTVRMRTDGRLKVCAAVEMRHHPMILTRVKVMADMDIAEKRASPGRPHKGLHPGEAGGSAGQRDPHHTRRKGSPPLSEYRYSHRQPGNLRHE